jgi:large subunit ribosomal protein L3
MQAILGSKKDMSQTFVDGKRVPVTRVQAGPCVVTQIRTHDSDGYWAIQLGLGEKKAKKAGKKQPRFIREVRVKKEPEAKVGDQIKVADVFSEGDLVMVTGTTKGKGFAGVVKRWGFKGGPRTHGQSDRQRAPGSIGQGTDPGRVWKGKKMAGRMGGETKTIKNLKIVGVDEAKNELLLSGPVPGVRDSLLVIKK